jgi:glutathione synthase/RimK-type ligase-like ATP-grasp enzyme
VPRRRVGLATYAKAPLLAADDQRLIPAFTALAVEPVPAVWSDASVNWRSFDAVMIRSCWDYHLRLPDFHRWLDELASSERMAWNPVSMVRWNADKRYLIDLAARGVSTVPTAIVAQGDADRALAIASERGWPRIVIKPAVSASGYETHLIDLATDGAARATIARVAEIGDVLVQPFVEEISRDGEFSFTFIDGAFSHATIKRAAPREFRVQTEHGGTADPVAVSARVVSQATAVLDALPERPLYARVDGIDRGGSFELMELELIEPNLFLEHGAGAADRLAAAFVNRCGWT